MRWSDPRYDQKRRCLLRQVFRGQDVWCNVLDLPDQINSQALECVWSSFLTFGMSSFGSSTFGVSEARWHRPHDVVYIGDPTKPPLGDCAIYSEFTIHGMSAPTPTFFHWMNVRATCDQPR